MTHVFIDYFVRRAQALREHITASPAPAPAPSSSSSSTRSSRPLSSVMPRQGERCVFCSIVDGSEPAVKVYEDAHVMAFFDIYPIRSGHTLVVPREHHELVSDLPDELGAAIGITLPRMARAIARATGQPAFNVVSNSGHGQVRTFFYAAHARHQVGWLMMLGAGRPARSFPYRQRARHTVRRRRGCTRGVRQGDKEGQLDHGVWAGRARL